MRTTFQKWLGSPLSFLCTTALACGTLGVLLALLGPRLLPLWNWSMPVLVGAGTLAWFHASWAPRIRKVSDHGIRGPLLWIGLRALFQLLALGFVVWLLPEIRKPFSVAWLAFFSILQNLERIYFSMGDTQV